MFVGALACLPEEVEPCAILPLEPLHTDPVRRHPGSLYAVVGGAHQSNHNTAIDVFARLRLGIFHFYCKFQDSSENKNILVVELSENKMFK